MPSWNRIAFILLVFAAFASGMACSDPEGAPDPKEMRIDDSEYSFHVVIHDGADAVTVGLRPAAVAPEAISGNITTRSNHDDPQLVNRLRDLLFGGGNGAENLIVSAGAQCGMIGLTPAKRDFIRNSNDPRYADLVRRIDSKSRVLEQRALVTPWSNGGWFIFPTRPNTCDAILEYEETLLCMADKLAEASEAIAPLS